MHPTFKTTWPFVLGWVFDIAIALEEEEEEELDGNRP